MSRFLILICLFAAFADTQGREPGKGINFYSIEKEMALGRQLAAEFQRDTKPLDSPTAQAYINDIGQRLAAQIGGPPFNYTFAVVADDPTVMHEVVAFPGGFLFVPASLILAVKDEDELAGMLAHAIAHIASRDGTRQATKAELININTVPVMYFGGWTGYAIRQGQSMAIPLGLLQMWRKFELDADRLAASKMPAAGYDPEALARYIDREQVSYDEYSQKSFSPLPRRTQRLEAIHAVIGELPQQVYPSHKGLEKIQEEVRRLITSVSPVKQPPAPPK
jgi:beta-barrel assembly-enhancing protease